MAIGERIRFIRNLRGMTQKRLGMLVGFPEKTADIRMAQYESGTRTPKEELVNLLAATLDVSPLALNVPGIDSQTGVMHTFFAMEDLYGLEIDKSGDDIFIHLDCNRNPHSLSLLESFYAWQQQSEKYRTGIITKEEYDAWRYNYPNQIDEV